MIALGTNGADHTMTVQEAADLYATGVRTLRSTLRWKRGPRTVILVTPWKAPRIEEGATNPTTGAGYAPYTWSTKDDVYRAAIRRVAANTRNVCVMPWHTYVAAHPERLVDGVHPDTEGLRVWQRMLYAAIRGCR